MSLSHTGTGDLFVFTVTGKQLLFPRGTLINSYFMQWIREFKAFAVVSLPPHQPGQLLICCLLP